MLSFLWSVRFGHLSITLILWFPPSCCPLHHTLSILPLPRADSLWTHSSVSLSVPTMAPSLFPQWHILKACEGIAPFSLKPDHPNWKGTNCASSVTVTMMGLHNSASCCYGDSNELFRLHYRFLWAYTDSSQTISPHWIFVYLFFTSFFTLSFFQSIFTKIHNNVDDILTFSKGLWLRQNLCSHCFLSWRSHNKQLSSCKVKRHVVLAFKKESRGRCTDGRKHHPEQNLGTAVQENKKSMEFILSLVWPERSSELSPAEWFSSSPYLANRALNSFWKSKKLHCSYLILPYAQAKLIHSVEIQLISALKVSIPSALFHFPAVMSQCNSWLKCSAGDVVKAETNTFRRIAVRDLELQFALTCHNSKEQRCHSMQKPCSLSYLNGWKLAEFLTSTFSSCFGFSLQFGMEMISKHRNDLQKVLIYECPYCLGLSYTL